MSAQDAVLTVPNLITLIRLCCLPVYGWLLLGADNRLGAAILLGALGATDWVDGYVARRFNQVSNLGKVLDPVADRLLFFVGIGGILIVGGVPLWFCAVVLVREVIVATATIALAIGGARRIDVTWFGKAGTFGLMFAFPLLLAGSSEVSVAPVFEVLGWVTGIPGVVLSYYAAARYVPLARDALRAGRDAQSIDTQASPSEVGD